MEEVVLASKTLNNVISFECVNLLVIAVLWNLKFITCCPEAMACIYTHNACN